ncbi:hypothetical protein EC957_010574 [Mortierella hygrophila]|uniref:Post-SET domain-containing protein n=1 Tax=Mortierella hygrophila TaxID=979708 RepID=A0A9P6FAF8_9FUNG|nr:hypothetical protein EC957_010574 [Mortierella hygrophila]
MNTMLTNYHPQTNKVPNSEETMELPAEKRIFPCKSLIKGVISHGRPYPSSPINVPYGKGLIATQDCPAGTVMEKFEGPVVEYSELGSDDIIYALNFQQDGQWKWMIAPTPAIYANHSCRPNSTVNGNQEIVTIRPIKAGEHVVFVYNYGTGEDKWDPLWTFECQCGAKKCQGLVNGYRSWEPLYEE